MKYQRINRFLPKLTAILVAVLLLSACFHDEDEGPATKEPINYTALACASTAEDSTFNGVNVVRIRSENKAPNTYEQITVVREGAQTIDYMVHSNANPRALLVLIAGGQLNSQIEGPKTGQQANKAGGNFLVRSAHLFAAQGFKVITIDRPSDWGTFVIPPGSGSGSAFDGYRTSTQHFNDLQAIINQENVAPALPVVIAGTSRGAISAVAQHNLAQYILLSAPVTSGNGSPIGSTGVMPEDLGNKPVHLIWHEGDDCFVSTPANANNIAGNFTNVTAIQVSGGINHPELSSRNSNKGCDGSKTYHGFLGIESCVVTSTTAWIDAQLQTP